MFYIVTCRHYHIRDRYRYLLAYDNGVTARRHLLWAQISIHDIYYIIADDLPDSNAVYDSELI